MTEGEPADLILVNARVVTMDSDLPEAEAVAIRDGRILIVGSTRAVEAAGGADTVRIDLDGHLILPGLTDAHGHLMGLGDRLATLDLTGTRSEQEVIERVRRLAGETPAGDWIRGRGWDQNDWEDAEFPRHRRLSAAIPDHPVYLRRVDGHAGWVNQRAMELAGIDAGTPDPQGGRILRDEDGPTGVLIDAANDAVERVIPKPGRDERLRRLEEASRACLRAGLTSIHDAGAGWDRVDLYRELIGAGRMKLRVYVMVGADPGNERPDLGRPPVLNEFDGRLAVRSVKLYMDGALGSRGAALLEPYSDDPENRGLLLHSPDTIRDIAVEAMRKGYQVNIHAIGDRANRLSLDVLESALAAVPGGAATRPRIEHAQVLDPSDIPRFAGLGIIASVQPTHCTSDMSWAGARLGPDREGGAYPWAALLRSGARLACGSDFPVESEDPLPGLFAAVTRRGPDGDPPGGWHPEQRMSMQQALACFTRDAAHAAFEEDRRGTITAGKSADLTVLDRDITTLPPEEILRAAVEMTIVGGDIAYRKGE